VPLSHWAYADIEKLYQGGYVVGCQATPQRKYCPEGTLSRAEAAVFVVRGHHTASFLPPEPNPSDLHFADVARGTWYAKWVAAAYEAGLTRDCEDPPNRGDDRFRPGEAITRAEAACMMARAKD